MSGIDPVWQDVHSFFLRFSRFASCWKLQLLDDDDLPRVASTDTDNSKAVETAWYRMLPAHSRSAEFP